VKALGPDVKSWVCPAAASGESKTATRDAAVRTGPLQQLGFRVRVRVWAPCPHGATYFGGYV
jgi:hypothetical protein